MPKSLAVRTSALAIVVASLTVLATAGSALAALQTTFTPGYQTNGDVRAIVRTGGVVYIGGSFTSVRPAGNPLGTGEVARNNLAAFDAPLGRAAAVGAQRQRPRPGSGRRPRRRHDLHRRHVHDGQRLEPAKCRGGDHRWHADRLVAQAERRGLHDPDHRLARVPGWRLHEGRHGGAQEDRGHQFDRCAAGLGRPSRHQQRGAGDAALAQRVADLHRW